MRRLGVQTDKSNHFYVNKIRNLENSVFPFGWNFISDHITLNAALSEMWPLRALALFGTKDASLNCESWRL